MKSSNLYTKPFLTLIIIATFFVAIFYLSNNNAQAQCQPNNDWPQIPCNDAINLGDPNQKPIHGDKEDWKTYYNMKGKEWMEMKKAEMYQAERDKILKEWYEYGKESYNFANFDVWYYYNLYGEAPDILQYYHGNVQKDWIKPIITYYYVSPIVLVITGIGASVAGFFATRKLVTRTRK